MDATKKLAIKLGDRDLAAKLVDGGFNTPGDIRRASDEDLRAIKGIGQATVDGLRVRLGQRRQG